jgi:hypothetical protein
VDRRHTKRSQSPPEIQKRGPISGHTRGVPRGRPNLEAGDTHRESPLERKLETPRDLLVEKLTHILKGKERSESIPKVMILKSSRNPNHPLSMEILRKGKRQKLGCLV